MLRSLYYDKEVNTMQKFIGFLGRLCFSLIFILSGINKILHWDATEQYLVNQMLDVLSKSYHYETVKTLFEHIVPLAPTLLVIATIAELLGGALVLLGFQVRLGALILCLFLIPTTLLFHNFWVFEGKEMELQLSIFLRNLSIFGGGLILLALGKGPNRLTAGEG